MNAHSFRRSPNDHPALPAAAFFNTSNNQYTDSSSQMKSVDLSRDSTFSFPQHPSQSSVQSSSSKRDSQSSVASNTSSISSLVTSPISPRLTFQTFSKFIPLSWGVRSTPPAPPHPLERMSFDDDQTVIASSVAPPSPPRKSGSFVSREKQLRKLKNRMEVEGAAIMKVSVNIQCKKCSGHDVCI